MYNFERFRNTYRHNKGSRNPFLSHFWQRECRYVTLRKQRVIYRTYLELINQHHLIAEIFVITVIRTPYAYQQQFTNERPLPSQLMSLPR